MFKTNSIEQNILTKPTEQSKTTKEMSDNELQWMIFKPFFVPKSFENQIRTITLILITIVGRTSKSIYPLILKNIIDAMASQDYNSTLNNVFLLLANAIFTMVLDESRHYIFNEVKRCAMVELSAMITKHILSLSQDWHLKKKMSCINRALENAVGSCRSLIDVIAMEMGGWVVEITVYVWMLFTCLSSGPVVGSMLTGIITYMFIAHQEKKSRKQICKNTEKKEKEADQNKLDSLTNQEAVKFSGSENYESQQFANSQAAASSARMQIYSSHHTWSLVKNLLLAFMFCGSLALCANEVINDHMTVGEFMSVQVILTSLMSTFGLLNWIMHCFSDAFMNIRCLVQVLKEDDILQDKSDHQLIAKTENCTGTIEFKEVSFKYSQKNDNMEKRLEQDLEDEEKVESDPAGGDSADSNADPERLILDNVSFTVKEGESCAFVGSTGSGKSTLVRLLYRLYDVESGKILINGTDISKVSQKSLRSNLGIVPQDTTLFNNTLVYNLTQGSYFIKTEAELRANPEALAKVMQACQQAKMDVLMEKLTKGYDTQVGERGLRLSGGEKQRLSIARCLIRDPSVCVFDEATSALDSVTEREIQRALDLLNGRTTFVVAHRLSTVQRCNQIVVLEQGKVQEVGTHQELINNQGRYQELWSAQESINQETKTLQAGLI